MRGRLLLISVLAAFLCTAPLSAQSPSSESETAAPAHVALVEGAASLEREGRAENAPLNMPLLSGDRLRTLEGRVEVLFADGSTLHLDNRSTIDVQSDDLVRLTEGRMRLNILGPVRTVAYRIDSPAGSARITQPGEYRLALLRSAAETQLEIAVVRGAAEIFTDQGSTPVRAGERAYASAGLAPSYAYAYNSANWDAFDRWSEARRDVRLGVSSQYLSSDMQAYAPLLDESGDWRQTESYGYAWYPRVSPDWRPYYNGRWDSYPRYGWTWIGADRFAWPTHHYGRWGFSAGVWFWIPSSRWAPAYVSWASAPGYVSWCPLGFDNRPIIGIDLYRVGPGYYSPWRAWTAVSYSHFGGRNYYVNQRAVNWDRLDRGQRPRFEPRASAPGVSRDIAVPRNATPIRWAGSRDLPPKGGSHVLDRGDARPAGSPVRDSPPSRDTSSRGSWLPPAGGRTTETASPRYVNRGDEIIRSRTERPTPPATSAVPRSSVPRADGVARDTRTIPEGPARAAPPAVERDARPSAQPRGYELYQPAARPRAGETPSYQPRASEPRPAPARGLAPRAYDPRPAPDREPAPRVYERSRPEPALAPQRSYGPERPAPAERSPSRGEGRQPPPNHGAAPSRPAPSPSGGVAVPRRGRGGV